jgi:hypothetical protein
MDKRMNMWTYFFTTFLLPATNHQPHIRAVSLAVLGSAYSHTEDGAIILKNSSAPIVDTLYHNVNSMTASFIQRDAQGMIVLDVVPCSLGHKCLNIKEEARHYLICSSPKACQQWTCKIKNTAANTFDFGLSSSTSNEWRRYFLAPI